jgi:hypothetical protein
MSSHRCVASPAARQRRNPLTRAQQSLRAVAAHGVADATRRYDRHPARTLVVTAPGVDDHEAPSTLATAAQDRGDVATVTQTIEGGRGHRVTPPACCGRDDDGC